MSSSLFDGQLVRLGPFDPDRDAEIESKWSHDAEFLRQIEETPARPLSPFEIKKKYEQLEKDEGRSRNNFRFAIRLREDDRLLGFVSLHWIEWTHGTCFLTMGIGALQDRGHGYGTEALQLLLRYAFVELNLYRIGAFVSQDNPRAIAFFERNGFVQEVRRREAINRDGRRWDSFGFGILREEWERKAGNVKRDG